MLVLPNSEPLYGYTCYQDSGLERDRFGNSDRGVPAFTRPCRHHSLLGDMQKIGLGADVWNDCSRLCADTLICVGRWR